MTDELKTQLTQLFSDEAVIEELQKITSENELKDFLAAKGISISDEEFEELRTQAQTTEEGEMSEEALEDIAGGIISNTWWRRVLIPGGGYFPSPNPLGIINLPKWRKK